MRGGQGCVSCVLSGLPTTQQIFCSFFTFLTFLTFLTNLSCTGNEDIMMRKTAIWKGGTLEVNDHVQARVEMGCGKGQFYGITIVFHWILENFISNLFEILYLTLCQFISVCRERSVKISLNLKFSINSELDCPIRGRCKLKI